MASVITAGTASNTALTLSSDTSGELQLKTNNGSTTAMTLTTAGNVGIGTTSPSYPLHVSSSGNNTKARFTNGTTTLDLYCGGAAVYTGTANGATSWEYANNNTYIAAYVNSAERMRIDSSGNVGIGSTSPLSKLEVVGGQFRVANTSTAAVCIISTDSTSTNGVTVESSYYGGAGYGPMKFNTGGSERMRIDSDGNVKLSTAGTKILNSSGNPILQQTGSVLQVVTVGYATQATSTSTTYADTGLSASITPTSSSSKILVIVSQGVNPVGGAAVGYGYQVNAGVQLLRGSTVLITPASDSGGKYSFGFGTGAAPASGNIVGFGIVNITYLDSPATTSSTTYKTQFAKGTSGMSTVYANDGAGGSYITLMEIAA